MYLKSLVLKGFKSFADRSVLTLEPGITAIVGPNGSGKSNISDAVLWVLGERNAKHLRGHSMEDVIFAGSSARKATGVAEVELVLDNTDGTLPVDYNEVSIMRRMYRSGESEYLINGTLARRMDVLDILHDSGLGTGTHSIISQGSLDSILQSKPEDRRALIEEAAGVLKHKQRKAKSERKLEQMQTHVSRVRDVVGEVQRQLGPLERKAKRARTYKELSAQLGEIELTLAVDDLRMYRRKWDESQSAETVLAAQLEEKRLAIETAEKASAAIQERIRLQSVDAGELSRQYREAAAAVEHLDSAVRVIHERKRSAQTRAGEIALEIENLLINRKKAEGELAAAQAALEEVAKALAGITGKVETLETSHREMSAKRRGMEDEHAKLEKDIKAWQADLEQTRRKHAQTQEALTNGLAHVKVVEGHAAELELSLSRARADADVVKKQAQAAQDELAQLNVQESEARARIGTCLQARDAARESLDAAKENESTLKAQINALEEIERAGMEVGGMAKKWLMDHTEEIEGLLEPLSHAVKAQPGKEGLVETLLGSDISLLFVDDALSAENIARALAKEDLTGEVEFMIAKDSSPASARKADRYDGEVPATPLLEYLTYPETYASAVTGLLGDVMVCADLEAALKAHASDAVGLRFAAEDGSLVWPNGKVLIANDAQIHEDGVLMRMRRIAELKEEHGKALTRLDGARAELSEAEAALSAAQTVSLELSEKLALLRGNVEASKKQLRQAEEKLEGLTRELESVAKQREEAEAVISSARPDVETYEERIAELTRKIEEGKARQDAIGNDLEPLRRETGRLSKELSEAKLEAAKLTERHTYSSRVQEGRLQDLVNNGLRVEEAQEQLNRKKASSLRLEPVIVMLEELILSARRWTSDLEQRAAAAQDSSSTLHSEVTVAQKAVHDARNAFDAVNERLAGVRVEKGRLELQVEAAVNVIVQDCSTPLETALETPEPEDRASLEEDMAALRRRISNLGAINPDAAEEYEALKDRYDYLAGQLEDLDEARKALTKINRIIDVRMKDDFIATFEQVDANFKEIFALLFPGGSASLSLIDPEDVENSGVEVHAQPRGKRITKMLLMSGGEKSLTALALLFAVYRTRSTPFYILDEVEAALDDSNLRRLIAYISRLRDETQLLMITHQRRTMETADVLFGVSMQADGVTKVISQKLDHALRYAE